MSDLKQRLTLNASTAILQVVVTALVYFFLYKYLLDHLGEKNLGVWSLILSFSSIANLANMGLTSGLVKFVAESKASNEKSEIGRLIMTSLVSLLLLFGLVSLLALFVLSPLLRFVVEPDYLTLAISIIPYSLASFSISAMSGVFTSVLEGYQKNYLRHMVYLFSGLVMYGGTLLLAPEFQLKGVAMAQVGQASFVFIASWLMMNRVDASNRVSNWRWSNVSFKRLFNYGFKFQAVSIFQLLYEPTTKLLLSKFGGLSVLAHYEMASRLVTQFRAVLVNANQVIIPVVAETALTKPREELNGLYKRMMRLMVSLTFPLTTLVIILSPLIALVWIGNPSPVFSYSMYVLLLSMMINIVSGPAYFSAMGEGKLTSLVLVHGLMALLNLTIGIVLGHFFEGYGIIMAWGLSLTIGSTVLIVVYQRALGVRMPALLSKNEYRWVILSLMIGILSMIILPMDKSGVPFIIQTAITIFIALSCFIFTMIINQQHKLIASVFTSAFNNHGKKIG
ncbi:MAG TPA: hypothetical protein DD409_07405 [Bacteroidales bacterium]|nr:hypothetical protein [Bacteroidales bacterium]